MCLSKKYEINISIRTLKRFLNRLGLFLKKNYSNITDVALFLINELEHSGKQHGYKMIHMMCIENGNCVTQETIRELLYIFYPNGIKHRQQRRPNYLWHIDGYDKLKPFGICIHGAIDGFSRYVLWLKAYKTNNDPKLISGYYTETVNMMDGCLLRVRADLGTENCYVRDIHMYLISITEDHGRFKQ
ncbi:hypothetical protein MAR_021379 [Mya arenaria]|uniref:Integrase core domain-containing protein n=1 Tax=Mya arenaria TaxID=6604 RepID=A0ABY7EAJ5_MYAAR|nr:hypothetical protein MAR_021379 [Mya arenaria]